MLREWVCPGFEGLRIGREKGGLVEPDRRYKKEVVVEVF